MPVRSQVCTTCQVQNAIDPAISDLGGEHRAEPLPPETHSLVADVDAPLMKQVLDVTKRQREPDVHHDSQADNFGAATEALERVGFGHSRKLTSALPRLKLSLSDKAHTALPGPPQRRGPVRIPQLHAAGLCRCQRLPSAAGDRFPLLLCDQRHEPFPVEWEQQFDHLGRVS
jgi:hypothetical protein